MGGGHFFPIICKAISPSTMVKISLHVVLWEIFTRTCLCSRAKASLPLKQKLKLCLHRRPVRVIPKRTFIAVCKYRNVSNSLCEVFFAFPPAIAWNSMAVLVIEIFKGFKEVLNQTVLLSTHRMMKWHCHILSWSNVKKSSFVESTVRD